MTLPPAGVPTTRAELTALRAKRSALSDQLQNVSSRRNDLARQLERAAPAAQPGLEARLKLLDDRILAMEKELQVTGDQLANAPAELTTSTSSQMPPDVARTISKDLVPIVAILSVFVLGPFALAMSRLIWKRGNVVPRPQTDAATQQRLEQLQQSVDTIAVEVERISEAQRFLTKLLNDRDRSALGAGSAPAQPIGTKKSVMER